MARYKPSMDRAPVFRVALLTLFTAVAGAQSQPIAIRVVQGDNAINSIRMHRGHDLVVQVLNDAGEPVPHATVSFILPATGASARFGDRGLSVTVEADERGMAAGRGLEPNNAEGQFRIRVTASWRGDAANATIQQTNAEPAGKGGRTKWIVIAAVVAGGAAGGLAAAHGGKSQEAAVNTGSSTAVATITPGTPAFGPPH
jgi:hypothetical protein